MWFCDHFEWWVVWWLWRVTEGAQVTVGGQRLLPLEHGLTFGVGRGYSHTCVYVEFL